LFWIEWGVVWYYKGIEENARSMGKKMGGQEGESELIIIPQPDGRRHHRVVCVRPVWRQRLEKKAFSGFGLVDAAAENPVRKVGTGLDNQGAP
jgi:hypothetical protein